ncbi:tetratricopeptide repeat protein [Crocosphaera sp. Alani8]|uniref:tetratricopeptide repeat protein n=1 Tax=Crocosphaera sp. Alani8 TaxID=3038952 RepID=UPI00313B91CC
MEDKEELKYKFCKAMIPVAQSIGYDPTLKEIKKFEISVSHLQIIATVMKNNIEDKDICLPFIALQKFYAGKTNYQIAETWGKNFFNICQKRFGEEHPDVAQSMNNLAKLYHSQGKYEVAKPLYEQAIKIFETVLGNSHPWTITVRNNYQIMLIKMS